MTRMMTMLCALALMTGCASVPLDSNLQADELVASEGVLAYFADPDVNMVEASGNITCKRHRRVGTHLISKICRTKEEWAELARDTRDTHNDHRAFPGCNPTASTGTYMNPGVTGALSPTACGDAINRGGR